MMTLKLWSWSIQYNTTYSLNPQNYKIHTNDDRMDTFIHKFKVHLAHSKHLKRITYFDLFKNFPI